MLVVPNKRKLVLNARNYAPIVEAIPHAKVFEHEGKTLTAVDHGVEEVQVLRNLGYKKLPSPILHYYDWPARFPAMEHQKHTASFLISHRRALVLSAPGSGKSISSLWAADYLLQEGVVRRVLIVAPLSTLKPVWAKELVHHMPHRAFRVITGTRDRREQLIEDEHDFGIVNHDGFTTMPDAFARYDLIIYDEATSLKTPSSIRFKKFLNHMNKYNPRLWLMTGTPIAQSPVDAWALAKLVGSSVLPRSFTGFKDLVMQKVTQFKWVPRSNALDICQKVLQPSIRYDLSECKELPDTVFIDRECELTVAQRRAYKEMSDEAVIVSANITAANAAVLFQKLIQISCIAYDTPVLTNSGWKPIQSVSSADRVWDGVEWVAHDGLVDKGVRPVMECYGVYMTAEHEVLTVNGWRQAQEVLHGKPSERPDRAEVWIPHRYRTQRHEHGQGAESAMAVQMRLWEHSDQRKPVLTVQTSDYAAKLRVPSWQRDTQNVLHTAVQRMDGHEASVPAAEGQRLAQLWSAGHHCVRTLARFVREFLRGFARGLSERANAGSDRREWAVLAGKLSLGYAGAAGQQHTDERVHRHTEGTHDRVSSSASVWGKSSDAASAAMAVRMERGTSFVRTSASTQVFDIANAGPRHRFTVLDKHGAPLIVHNCGACYDANKNIVHFDDSDRTNALLELLSEIGDKAIVYVPLRNVQDKIHALLQSKSIDVEVVHGDVSKTERDRIFHEFQNTEKITVLLAHPKVASHGLTLTRAKSIIWYAPIYSLEMYEQANARIRRLTTEGKTTVYHLYATPFEKELYRRLKLKQKVLADFLNLVSGENG